MTRLAWLLLLASLVAFARPAALEAQVPGLVAAFSFNETSGTLAADSSGTGNNGTVTGATWTASGKYGGALLFNGTSNLVTVADANSLDLTNGMTLEAWVKPSTLTAWRNVILKERPGHLSYAMYASNGSTPAAYVWNSNLREAKGTAALSTAAWTHIATTYNGSQLRFFVNGAQVRSVNTSGNIITSTGRLTIGGNYVWSDEFFAGLIDDVRIYNRALSASEITTDMNTPVGTGPPLVVMPTVSITSPVNGATVSGQVPINATPVAPVGVGGVTFRVDGVALGPEDTVAPYSATWNAAAATTGPHVLTATVRDVLNNTGTSSPVNVTVAAAGDTVPPTVSITAPTAGSTVSGTVNVTANATDNIGVASVQFAVNGANVGAPATVAPYAYVWNTTGMANGSYTLTAIARDAANNMTTSAPVAVTVSNAPTGDTTPPTVSITSPANGAPVSGQVSIAATAADNVGVAGVTFMLDGVTTIGVEDSVPPYGVTWDASGSTAGTHSLTAVARDAAGNSTTSSPVSVTVTVDPNAPSQIGQWSAVQNWPLVAVHSTLLSDGRVLLWDGWEYGTTYAKVWNPANGTFLDIPIASQIFCSAHSVLPDGRILVTGGHSGTGDAGTNDASIYDPVSNTWTRLTDMQLPRWYPASVELKDGRVVVISGEITPGSWADFPEVYNPFTNSWSTLNVNTSDMHDPEYPLSFLAPNGKIPTISATQGITRVLDTDAPSWTALGNVPRKGSASMYAPGKIIYTGGGNGTPSSASGTAAMILDMNAPSPAWRTIAPMNFGRFSHNQVVLPDGKMLVVGGGITLSAYETGNGVRTPELFDPITETWKNMAPQAQARMYHSTALLMPDGRVLSAGGGRLYPAVDYKTAEIYSPPYLFKGARPTITAAPASAQYGANITVTTPNAASIASVSLVGLGSVTHTVDMNQRFVPLSFTKGAGTLSVAIPANANLAPPGPYMLFIVDSNGVPSVASIVRLAAATESIPPAVSMLAPSNGATISGTAVQLSANASDASGIASVQFLANGNSLGFATTSNPYGLTWNTTTAANGPYTMTAVAKDTLGNSTTSAPVSVTVSNTGPQLPAGLVLGLPFKEGAGTSTVDVSGNNHVSTISGATWTAAGRYGSALTFDGVNDLVTVNDSALLDLSNGMTLSAWVKPNALSTWPTVILKERPGDLSYALYANTPNPGLGGYLRTSSGFFQVEGGGALPLATWSHVAVTYDGSIIRTYVNGVQVASSGSAGPILASNSPLRIGGNTIWPGEFFNGAIDEVRVYNRPLSASELTTDMATALP